MSPKQHAHGSELHGYPIPRRPITFDLRQEPDSPPFFKCFFRTPLEIFSEQFRLQECIYVGSRAWAGGRPCEGWPSPPPSAAVGLEGACRPAFAAANHFDAELRQRLAQLVSGALTLRITQLLSLPPRMKGRTEFHVPAWCRQRRAAGR